MFGDGHHNAENIAKTIEIAVNEYNFDKNKIKGVVCDEGSALLRLFKQILNLDDDVEDFTIEKFCFFESNRFDSFSRHRFQFRRHLQV